MVRWAETMSAMAVALGKLSGSRPFPENKTPKACLKRGMLLCLFVLAFPGLVPQGNNLQALSSWESSCLLITTLAVFLVSQRTIYPLSAALDTITHSPVCLA